MKTSDEYSPTFCESLLEKPGFNLSETIENP